jgi:hypothetical protein
MLAALIKAGLYRSENNNFVNSSNESKKEE